MKERKTSKEKNPLKTKPPKSSSEMVVAEAVEKTKKNTSLRLEKKTLKALKIIAIEKETSLQGLIENLIENYIKKHTSKKN